MYKELAIGLSLVLVVVACALIGSGREAGVQTQTQKSKQVLTIPNSQFDAQGKFTENADPLNVMGTR